MRSVAGGGAGTEFDLAALIPGIYSEAEAFHVSPSGAEVAFAWNKTGQWQIYLVRLDDGHIRQITTETESRLSPRFSPDGKRLAYCQDYSGDEKFDLFLLNLDSKETRNITPGTDEAILPFIRWSPDGRSFALASNRSGKYSVYSMPSTGGDLRQISDHKYDDADPEWSPDGETIMFTAMTTGEELGVFLVSATGGAAQQLGDETGPIDASMPDWSPDGKRIALASTSRGMSDIGVYDLQERRIEWLTDTTNECYDPCWAPDGSSIAYRENHEGNVVIALHAIGGAKRTFQVEPGVHMQLVFTPDSKHLMFTFSGPRNPADLWMLDIRNGKFRRLTHSLPASIDRRAFVEPAVVRFESVGGLKIPAFLYKARRAGSRPPGLVYLHGGPTAQHENDWYPDVQDLVRRGFVVIAPNYRGSTGYGRAFREANRFVMGRDDLADVDAAAEYLVKEDLADPERIGVTGLSYGGYLTICALAMSPDRWAAGSALFPFLNWFTEYQNEREDLRYWDRENMGDPVENAERFHDASPIFFIDQVRAPVQLMAGTQDTRCPLSESQQAKDALQKLGRDVDFVVFEDEGHSFRKVQNRIDGWDRRAAFLEKHLRTK